ncbi:hypothetical protein K501DRAFT_276920 [Backusella circina FSU 941]|nr:hypothetical protein K501DRAFT_276920 [Backusella circina FSU 941]
MNGMENMSKFDSKLCLSTITEEDLISLFNSDDTITLTVEQVEVLMDHFISQSASNIVSNSENVCSTPRAIAQERISSVPLFERGSGNDDKSLVEQIKHRLNRYTLLKSIADESSASLENNGASSNIILKVMILETSKILTKEDKQNLISKLPPTDIVNGDIRPDFFSVYNIPFWNQVKEIERLITSNEFIKANNDPLNTQTTMPYCTNINLARFKER